MKTFRAAAVAGLTLFSLGTFASEGSAQTITASDGAPLDVSSVVEDAYGSSMQGMVVRAWFDNDVFFTNQWASIGSSYGIDNSHIRISVGTSENTFPGIPFFGTWDVSLKTTAKLQRLEFSGASGATVFDRSGGICFLGFGATGTPGSSCGGDVNTPLLMAGVTAHYTNVVSLNGTTYGDLYESLAIDFSNASVFRDNVINNNNSPFTIRMDTDLANYSGTQVPEPASLALVFSGLVGLGFAARRRVNR